jgi:Holliday junction DNA helicase RuvB
MAIQRSPFLSAQITVNEQDQLEQTLRPKFLREYIGQNTIKDNLKVFIEATKKRNEPLEHVLLHGPPGLGKTTLANIIAHEMAVNIKTTAGPAIEKPGDLAAILSNLKEFDILFIDEIHRLRPIVEEILYTAMEDYALDIIIGKGPSARTMRINLPQFTLIGATTKAGALSSPLRDRFGHIFRLNFYEINDILQIINRSSTIINCPIDGNAVKEVAKCSRFTPRIANRLLKRLRDFAEIRHQGIITLEVVIDGLKALGIDKRGLDFTDRELLKIIIEKFDGGPVGLNTIAASLGEEIETIEDLYEPYLMQIGFLKRTSRGRTATRHAYEHLGLVPLRILSP